MSEAPPAVIHAGYTALCTSQDGSIDGGTRHGLFDFDTRILSRHRLTLGELRFEVVGTNQPESDEYIAVLHAARPDGSPEGPALPQDAIEVRLRRRVGPGLLEEITLRNDGAVPYAAELRLELDADFRDMLELDAKSMLDDRIDRTWDEPGQTLELRYTAEHEGQSIERGLRVLIVRSTSPARADSLDGFAFRVEMPARAAWIAVLRYESLVDGAWRGLESFGDDEREADRRSWREGRLSVEGGPRVEYIAERAIEDLYALRNQELEATIDPALRGPHGRAWIANAGMPMFTGFFGRDSLTSAWQSSLLGPELARGALAIAAATQATKDDPMRDAEPGKMVHEMRRGPLSMLDIRPQRAYYGSQTTSAMFLLALSELWHWTGDTDALQVHRDAALRTFDWADRYGDQDGDGFLEYRRRAKDGLKNQGWKDSDEGIRYPDGRLVENPIATIEEQAFHFIAHERMAEILVALEEDDAAERMVEKADGLRARWHEAFWMPDERFYALALDGDDRQVKSITSNPGHALAAGIVPVEHAREVADRLLGPELFSGWGVRTLARDHPSYNPFAYHLGTVWPVENATFALGFKRYGLDEHVERLASALWEAAEACPAGRLPEVFAGHERSAVGRPVLYPGANSPQAWSASAVLQLIQVMLGLYPFAPMNALVLVRPRLPEWCPEVTLRNIRVGQTRLDLRFERQPDGAARHHVESQDGKILILSAGPPDDVAGPAEHLAEALKRAVFDHLPGRLGRAARIALGGR